MRKVLAITMLALLVGVKGAQATPIAFQFANVVNATIDFAGNGTTSGGGTFSFPNSVAFDFQVNGASGFPDGSVATGINGDFGNISGTFTIGTISCLGIFCQASVSGSGSFSLFDGVNTLTSTVTWLDITT